MTKRWKHTLSRCMMIHFFVAFPALLNAQYLSDTLKLGEISVFSSRPVEQTALTVTELDSALLSRQISRSLSELIAENSSLFIKSLGRGALATVSFRGTSPSHTIVNWNGLELNSPMLGMVDFSQIPVFFLDEVSILHGNSSLTEMPGALGGVLDLNTKINSGKGFSGTLMQGLGSYGTYDEYGRLDIGGKKIHSVTRLFYDHSDNNFRFRNYDTPDSVNLETGKKYFPVSVNKNADYTNKGLLQQLSFRKNDREVVNMNFWLQQSERSIPMLSTDESADYLSTGGDLEQGTATNRQNDRFFRSTIQYKKYGEKGKFTLFNGINYNVMSYRVENLVNGSAPVPQILSGSRILSVDNRATYRYSLSGRDELKADLRYLFAAVQTAEQVTGNHYQKNRGETTLNLSWFRAINRKFRLRSTLCSQFLGTVAEPFSFSLGGEYHFLPSDRLYLTSSLSSNHRFPTLNDLYFQPGGNPHLRPEHSISQELGLVWKRIQGKQGLSMSLSVYHSGVHDWIIWLPSFKGNWEPFNIEKVQTDGVEVNADYSGSTGEFSWMIHGNYAFTQSLNFGNTQNWADGSRGKQLPYIPRHSANLNLSSVWHGWSAVYSWNFYSERFTTVSNTRTSGRDYLYPYFMNQIRFEKNISVSLYHLGFGLSVYNLFNETYRSVLQRQMPGRNYQFSVRFLW